MYKYYSNEQFGKSNKAKSTCRNLTTLAKLGYYMKWNSSVFYITKILISVIIIHCKYDFIQHRYHLNKNISYYNT